MTLKEFNLLTKEEAAGQLKICCGSEKWVTEMINLFPYVNESALVKEAGSCWYTKCREKDWLEAFSHHPKIGNAEELNEKFASTIHLAEAEQGRVKQASPEVIAALSEANRVYRDKFGFIFIVCAAGRSAAGMLRLMQDRLKNSDDEEMLIAMNEQFKITVLRLKKIIAEGDWQYIRGSSFTTHVLDTSMGKPGANITVRLKKKSGHLWQTFAQGVTDEDGRIPDLLPPLQVPEPGPYQISFDTGSYFASCGIKGFYPEVEIQFSVSDNSHYHVPLLINPFGFSTYRGS